MPSRFENPITGEPVETRAQFDQAVADSLSLSVGSMSPFEAVPEHDVAEKGEIIGGGEPQQPNMHDRPIEVRDEDPHEALGYKRVTRLDHVRIARAKLPLMPESPEAGEPLRTPEGGIATIGFVKRQNARKKS